MDFPGTCKLCGQHTDLQDSHVAPKFLYRVAREGESNPVVVDGDVAVRTSEQDKEPLLCRACEGVFSKHESTAAKMVCKPDGTPGVLAHVRSGPWPTRGSQTRPIKPVVGESLARFAASIFWRYHVAKTRPSNFTLWSTHAHLLRKYLRCQTGFPDRMTLMLTVPSPATIGAVPFSHVFWCPATSRKGDDGVHHFYAAGLLFGLYIGEKSRPLKGACLAGPKPHVVLTSKPADELLPGVIPKIGRSTPKGKLAERLK